MPTTRFQRTAAAASRDSCSLFQARHSPRLPKKKCQTDTSAADTSLFYPSRGRGARNGCGPQGLSGGVGKFNFLLICVHSCSFSPLLWLPERVLGCFLRHPQRVLRLFFSSARQIDRRGRNRKDRGVVS